MDLELGRVTVLIGEQATGKSTVAKLLAVCRYFSYIYDDGFYVGDYDSPILEGLTDWGLENYIQPQTSIKYKCEHYDLTIGFVTEQVSNGEKRFLSQNIVPLTDKFRNLIANLDYSAIRKDEMKDHPLSKLAGIPTSFFQNEVKQVMDNPFFLPTERGLQSIFSLPKGSVGNLSDALFKQLAEIDKITDEFKYETFIDSLNIYYFKANGNGYIRKSKEPLSHLLRNSASGYQSLIPVELICKSYIRKEKPKTIIVEEPELNIFPNAQMNLVQYLVSYVNGNESTLMLPTHSPYILTSLNNCMLAYHVGNKPGNKDKVSNIIEEKYWMNPDDVSAYMLRSDGMADDIVDREEVLIKAEMIDGVSSILNAKFDMIFNIDLGIDEKN